MSFRLLWPILVISSRAFGCEQIGQFANHVLSFSSEYSTTDWSASKILGACDVKEADDSVNAWSAKFPNKGLQWIEIGFPDPVYSSGAIIREANFPGAIRRLEVKYSDGTYQTVWAGDNYPTTNGVSDSLFEWETGNELTQVLRITIDTDFQQQGWETIDSAQLLGPPTY